MNAVISGRSARRRSGVSVLQATRAMKRCPECRRDYYDDTLLYCLDDGNALLEGPSTGRGEQQTAILPDPSVTGESRTQLQTGSPDTARESEPASKAQTRQTLVRWVVLVGGGTLILIASVASYLFLYKGSSTLPVSTRENMKFSKVTVPGDVGQAFISPDGHFIARIVREKNGSSIKLRQLSSTVERELVPPGTDVFIGGLVFSRDGNHIYYTARDRREIVGQLYRVSILGGEARKLLDRIDSDVTLSPDGTKLAFRLHKELPSPVDELIIANEDGTGEQILGSWSSEQRLLQPVWSPDGRVFACLFQKKDEKGEYYTIDAIDTENGSITPIADRPWFYVSAVRWLPSGEGILVAGKPRDAAPEEQGQLWLLAFPTGKPHKVTKDANNYLGFSLSADGRTGLIQHVNLSSNMWVVPGADTQRARQVTNSNSEIGELAWTPSGQLVYGSRSNTRFLDLWIMNADGSGNRQLTFTPEQHEVTPAVSPDGTQIVYVVGQNNFFSIWRIGINGGSPVEVVRDVSRYATPTFSADSKWIFYNVQQQLGGPRSFWKIPVAGGDAMKIRDEPCHVSFDSTRFVCAHVEPPSGAVKVRVVSAETGETLNDFGWPPEAGSIFPSPDARSLDFIAERDGFSNVWRMSAEGTKQQKITDWQTPATAYAFAWSRDGKDLAVVRDSQTSEIILINNFRP